MANVITERPSIIDVTDSSVKSTTLLDAFQELMILQLLGEQEYNLRNNLNPITPAQISTNYTSGIFGGTFGVPYVEEMTADGNIVEIARNYLFGIYDWQPGTAFFADCPSVGDAIIKLGKRIAFFNSIIKPTVVIQNPSSVLQLQKDEVNNVYNFTPAFPSTVSIDPDTGKITSDLDEYLRTLDDQLGFND